MSLPQLGGPGRFQTRQHSPAEELSSFARNRNWSAMGLSSQTATALASASSKPANVNSSNWSILNFDVSPANAARRSASEALESRVIEFVGSRAFSGNCEEAIRFQQWFRGLPVFSVLAAARRRHHCG